MKKIYIILSLIITVCSGCAELDLFDMPKEVLKHPLGTDSIRNGMTKEEVVSKWGKADKINLLTPEDQWGTQREEWVYLGRYSKVPLDRSYLFKTKYIVFDGDSVVRIRETPAPKDERLQK